MNNINLVPNQYKKAYSQKWVVVLGMIGFIFCVMGLVFLAFIPINQIKEEENKQIALEERLKSEEIQQVQRVINEVNEIVNKKEKALLILDEIDTPSPITRRTMDIIVESAPRNLRISTMKIQKSDNTIHISGKAKQSENVAEYIILLHNTKQFEKINYIIEQKNKTEQGDWIEYSIEMQDYMLVKRIKDLETQESIESEPEEIGSEDIL